MRGEGRLLCALLLVLLCLAAQLQAACCLFGGWNFGSRQDIQSMATSAAHTLLSRRWTRRALALLLLIVALAVAFSSAHAARPLREDAPVWPRPIRLRINPYLNSSIAGGDGQGFVHWHWKRAIPIDSPPLYTYFSDVV
ncbi:hypothetical protein ZWY2020_043665 [Hordeum vulgare]|nr:hypothetical protein ZWY2020_043665 [Hordeum vulgare]